MIEEEERRGGYTSFAGNKGFASERKGEKRINNKIIATKEKKTSHLPREGKQPP